MFFYSYLKIINMGKTKWCGGSVINRLVCSYKLGGMLNIKSLNVDKTLRIYAEKFFGNYGKAVDAMFRQLGETHTYRDVLAVPTKNRVDRKIRSTMSKGLSEYAFRDSHPLYYRSALEEYGTWENALKSNERECRETGPEKDAGVINEPFEHKPVRMDSKTGPRIFRPGHEKIAGMRWPPS